jgi:hypothetical protein
MTSLRVFLVAALAVAATGCVIHGHGRTHVSAGVEVGHVHHYGFYPDYDAYHCGGCGFWWVIDGGAWVEFRTRPSHIHLSPALVVIDVDDGPEPWVHVDRHRARGRPDRDDGHPGKGPPSGRGWKKDKD